MRIVLTIVVVATVAAGCRSAPAPVADVVAITTAALPSDPGDAAWQAAPEHVAKLLLQDLVEPRQQKITTPEVRVRALATNAEIALRLEWPDASTNDMPGAGNFNDGCAVQVPQKASATLPDPQMGMVGNGVAITFWRADWQASVNGRGDSIRDLYPNALIDHYPFEAASLAKGSAEQQALATQYAPAEGAGNRRGGARTSAVEDLIAEGPGTLAPAPATRARGLGKRTPTGWSVVIARPLPDGLTMKTPSQIAFAVWEGASQEGGARKMRTGWIPLSMRGGH
jgi:DMSO reductase family type II enzyme heme b subunit